jgi:hypothetical protein
MKTGGKKGSVFLLSTTMFIVLNILFFVMLMVFVFKSSTGALIYEQTYAKQIALLVDASEPGMHMNIVIDELWGLAKENNYEGDVVAINEFEHSIDVRVDYKGGYRQIYFSDHKLDLGIKDNLLTIEVRGGENE